MPSLNVCGAQVKKCDRCCMEPERTFCVPRGPPSLFTVARLHRAVSLPSHCEIFFPHFESVPH